MAIDRLNVEKYFPWKLILESSKNSKVNSGSMKIANLAVELSAKAPGFGTKAGSNLAPKAAI